MTSRPGSISYSVPKYADVNGEGHFYVRLGRSRTTIPDEPLDIPFLSFLAIIQSILDKIFWRANGIGQPQVIGPSSTL